MVHHLLTTTNIMIVRGPRLSRVRRLRLLPPIARRALTEGAAKVVPAEQVTPPADVLEPQETQHVADMRERLKLQKEAIESLKIAVQKPFSAVQDELLKVQSLSDHDRNPAEEIHRPGSEANWALAGGYEVGGFLKHGKGPLNRHDEKGLPTWGDWGICLKILGLGGPAASTAITLSVSPLILHFQNVTDTI